MVCINDIEKKVAGYERRYNFPYVQLIKDQLSSVENAIGDGDRERIRQSLWCAFSMLTPYITVGKHQIKNRISDLGNIIDHTEFTTEADEIYRMLLKIIEEKTGSKQKMSYEH